MLQQMPYMYTSGFVMLSCLNGSCLFGRRLTLFKTRTLYHRLSRLFMSCDQNNYYVHKLPTLIKFIVLQGSNILRYQVSSFTVFGLNIHNQKIFCDNIQGLLCIFYYSKCFLHQFILRLLYSALFHKKEN